MQFFRLQKLCRNNLSYEVYVLLLYTRMFDCAFRIFCCFGFFFCCGGGCGCVAAAAAAAASAAASAAATALLPVLLGVAFFFQLCCENVVHNSQTSSGYEYYE